MPRGRDPLRAIAQSRETAGAPSRDRPSCSFALADTAAQPAAGLVLRWSAARDAQKFSAIDIARFPERRNAFVRRAGLRRGG